MMNLVASFARNRVFANIVLLIVFVGGGAAVLSMVRETFPQYSIDMVMVTVPWPGADPAEVEEGICRKIEEAIDGLEGIRRYSSMSSEHVGTVLVEVSENYTVAHVKDRVRNAVEAISTFPIDAERPIVEEMIFRDNVMLLALQGKDLSERELKEWAVDLADEIRALPEVSQVQIIGARDYEISVELSEERLREYGLTFDQVAMAIRQSNLNLAGGTVRTQGEEVRLRTIGRKYTGEELAKIVVLAQPGGDLVTLDRVATIRDAFTEDVVLSRFNGMPTMTVGVMKTEEEDTLAIDRAVRAFVAEKNQQLPDGMSITTWAESAEILQGRLDYLINNGITGLIIVFTLLWLLLDIRLSFWAAMGIPISLTSAFAIMWLTGQTINMISLFALIMVLGVLVDDAIIIGEAIYVARKNGAPPLQAAIDGVKEVGMPVAAGVTTTMASFIPLMFIEGVMGKFIFVLPVCVIACLGSSLFESLFLLPAHLSTLPDLNRKFESRNPLVRFGIRFHRTTNRAFDFFVRRVYTTYLRFALRHRYITVSTVVGFLIIVAGVLKSGFLKYEFFPSVDGDVMTATVEFPDGTPLDVTAAAVQKVEAAIQRLSDRTPTHDDKPLLKNMYSTTGASINDMEPTYGNHVGSVRVELIEPELRDVSSETLMAEWEEELGPVPGLVSLSIIGLETGPPGKPIEVWLQGDNADQLLNAAEELKTKLATFDGVNQIQDDFRPGKNEMRFTLKPEARTLGLTVSDLARQVNAGYFGEEAIRLQRGRDDIRVRVRYTSEERKRLSDLEKIRIRTPQGHEVPLLSVADVTFGPGYSVIRRTDGMRRVAVSADVNVERANSREILAALEKSYFPELERRYPGVFVSVQGEQERSLESFRSLYFGYPLSLVAIYVLIASMFGSYLQPLLIMVTVPFGIIGAVIGHLVLGYPLSILSFFGIVAVSGIVVNDAIVLVDCINEHISKGLPLKDALVAGGTRRFRAVFLTSSTTIGGLLPMLATKNLQAQFLIPMTISIAVGVAFSTVLTLLFLPCLVHILNDIRRLVRRLRTNEWPTQEEVEPAYQQAMEDAELARAAASPAATVT